MTEPGGEEREVQARDRDAAGRARNARARDATGRPLSRGAEGVTPQPDAPGLPPAQSLDIAQALLDSGRPFSAHEVLEASWKAAPTGERELWRGLAQLAVGLTHLQRGNRAGTIALLRRGADRIEGYADHPPHRIDVAELVGWARELAGRVERQGTVGSTDPTTAPRLRSG